MTTWLRAGACSSYLMSLRASLNWLGFCISNCVLVSILVSGGSYLGLRMLKPDCERMCSLSFSTFSEGAVDRMGWSLWMLRLSMSTLERAMMALLMRVELFKLGRFLSWFLRCETDLALSRPYIIINQMKLLLAINNPELLSTLSIKER